MLLSIHNSDQKTGYLLLWKLANTLQIDEMLLKFGVRGELEVTINIVISMLRATAKLPSSSPASKHSQPLQLACIGPFKLHEGCPEVPGALHTNHIHHNSHTFLCSTGTPLSLNQEVCSAAAC